jgi:hypothetical protein
MGFLILVLVMPFVIGLSVNYMMKKDAIAEKKRSRLRMFQIRRPTLILCFKHLSIRKKGRVALLDDSRCKVCLDSRKKP